MLLIRWFTTRLTNDEVSRAGSATPGRVDSLSLIITIGLDVLVDGVLIGVAFAAGAKAGLLITIALTLEVLFLGLSAAGEMSKAAWSRSAVIATIAGLALLLPAGGVLGASVLAELRGPELEVALSFGAAALLYLVTEELLVAAHEIPETPASTAMFFAGFLLLLILDMLSQAEGASDRATRLISTTDAFTVTAPLSIAPRMED